VTREIPTLKVACLGLFLAGFMLIAGRGAEAQAPALGLTKPIALSSLPSGRLVAMETGGRLVQFTRGGIIQKSVNIAPGYQPLDMVATSMGGRDLIFVSCTLKGTTLGATFSRLAVVEGEHITYLPLPGAGWFTGLAMDSANQMLYAVNTVSGEILAFNPYVPSPRPVYLASVRTKVAGPAAVDSVGRRLFVADVALGTLSIVNLPTRQVQALPGGLGEPHALAFDAATKRLYVADSAGDRLLLYDLSLSAPTPKVFAARGLADPRGLAIDDAGNLWVVNRANGAVLAFDKSGALLSRF
jgi:DNA-binding beta-propeller fold protein YncE